MTEISRGPKYTDRQLALLRGQVQPDNNDEWNYIQDHANDVLPTDVKDRKPIFGITADDLERSRKFDRGSTPAAHQSEAMDENED